MYRIGELAKLTGVTPDTIRYYEKQNLMNHNVRTEGGFRLYAERDLQRLRFIRYTRLLGFTLETIRDLLTVRLEPNHDTCLSIIQERLSEVEARLEELRSMQRSLQELNDINCDSESCITHCLILDALEQGAESTISVG